MIAKDCVFKVYTDLFNDETIGPEQSRITTIFGTISPFLTMISTAGQKDFFMLHELFDYLGQMGIDLPRELQLQFISTIKQASIYQHLLMRKFVKNFLPKPPSKEDIFFCA